MTTHRKCIALVEDDDVIRQNYVDLLEDNGFLVRPYATRVDAEHSILESLPDLALLDISLNEEREGGYDLCRSIRKASESVPIIFLTSYDEDVDEICGLRIGADDFISKQESFGKILVRINSLLRRFSILSNCTDETNDSEQHIVEHGPLHMDMLHYRVSWKGEPIRLPLTQLWIVYALASRAGQLKNREALMKAANITHSGSNTIPVHINSIRNKFKSVDASFDHIENERGIGYRWK